MKNHKGILMVNQGMEKSLPSHFSQAQQMSIYPPTAWSFSTLCYQLHAQIDIRY
jgi:hypothetical protein